MENKNNYGVFRIYPNATMDYDIVIDINHFYRNSIPETQEKLYKLVEQTNNIIEAMHDFPRDINKTEAGHKKKRRKVEGKTKDQNYIEAKDNQDYGGKKVENENSIKETKGDTEERNQNDDMIKLMKKIEERNKVIGPNKIKVKYLNQSLHIAQSGLVGKYANPDLAIEKIKILRDEILLREGGRIKNRNVIRLGLCTFAIGTAAFILGYFARLISCGKVLANTGFGRLFLNNRLYPYLIVFSGAVIGAWIGYSVEKKDIKFEELPIVHKDRLRHIPRLILFGVSSVILLLFFNADIIGLHLGNITNEGLMSSFQFQFLFGAIAGLLGNRLTKGLFEKSADLFNQRDQENESNENDADE